MVVAFSLVSCILMHKVIDKEPLSFVSEYCLP